MANRTYEDWLNSGITLYENGEYELAAHHFHMARTCNPYREEATYNFGLVRLKQDRWADCIELCDEVIAIRPSHQQAHANRAESLVLLSRFDEAEKAINFLTQLSTGLSSDGQVAHLRGLLCYYKDELPRAETYLLQAIELHERFVVKAEKMVGFTSTQIGDLR